MEREQELERELEQEREQEQEQEREQELERELEQEREQEQEQEPMINRIPITTFAEVHWYVLLGYRVKVINDRVFMQREL